MAKLLVVTGAGKGIGRAIATRFASSGFDVVLCARTQSDLEKLALELKQEYGIQAYAFAADVSVPQQVDGFTKQVLQLGRPIDVLVNNAGFFLPGEVLNEPDGALEKTIEANLYSAYRVTRALVPTMKSTRSGHIFNMCSIASIKAYPNGGSYTISKFAMLGFSKVLREELKEFNVRVTAILPGATRTASWDGTTFPDERFMPAEDIAETVWAAWSLGPRSVVEEVVIRPQLGDL